MNENEKGRENKLRRREERRGEENVRGVCEIRSYRLDARRAVVAWDGDFAALGVVGVHAVIVVLAASNAEAVLSGLDLLNVEATLVGTGEDAERLRGDTIVSLSGRVELTALVGGVQTAQMRGVDAAGDLANLVLVRGSKGDISGVGEEVGGETALVGIIVASLVCAVCLGAGALGNANVGVSAEGCDEAHVLERVDFDNVI